MALSPFALLHGTYPWRHHWCRIAYLLLLWLGTLLPAHAHDPFDGDMQVWVFEQKLEVRITLGFDASRMVLANAGLAPEAVSALKREAANAEAAMARLPLAAADNLIQFTTPQGEVLAPTAVLAAFGDMETYYVVIYRRPDASRIQVTAPFLGAIQAMRPVSVSSADAHRKLLSSVLLSHDRPQASIALVAEAAPGSAHGLTAMFQLGVEHILTGWDHLLFLGALLLGMHALRPMFWVLASFTLAHSLTLALAALDLVRPASAVVEPLIALSIIFACVHNLRRPDAITARFWMAIGFGLIHGFGFAGILRETGLGTSGNSLVLPLLAFNLGVEAGQLLVALPVIAALRLGRRRIGFVRYGQPGLSLLIAAVGALWLVQRVAFT